MNVKIVYVIVVLIVCIIIFCKIVEHEKPIPKLISLIVGGLITTILGYVLIPNFTSIPDMLGGETPAPTSVADPSNLPQESIDVTLAPTFEQAVLETESPKATELPNNTEIPEEEAVVDETLTLTENHSPNDVATSVSTPQWDAESDLGIDGNRYEGGFKVIISNMFNSMGSSIDNKVKSRITIPLTSEYKKPERDHTFEGTIVLDNSMFGSKSRGTIKILINNKKVFSTGKIDGETTKSFPFKVNYGDADSIVIVTNATLNKGDFVYGIVNSK